MSEVPTFFFSHARQDSETPGKYLRRFFDDLEIKLAQWAGINLDEKRLATIDARVPQGDDWDNNLTKGLSSDNVLVAILTPLYFKRPNCGKELAVFFLRSRNLGINRGGALTGAQNIMLIRWLPENAYASNTARNSLIPPILRLIEDTPADDGRDTERTQAIERYRKKGMEKCVQVEPHYGELLDLFVARIRDMPKLGSSGAISFATAVDAFRYDWNAHFGGASGSSPAAPSASVSPTMAPQPFASVVAFYITRSAFTIDQHTVAFADSLIAEARHDGAHDCDPILAALMSDVRSAAMSEGLSTFHAAGNPVVPRAADSFLARLSALSRACVLTALVVDRTVWPGVPNEPSGAIIEQIVRSVDWTGPVFLHSPEGLPRSDQRAATSGMLSRVIALPQHSGARVPVLRRAFIEARGQLLRNRTGPAPDADDLPLLKGVKRKGS